jgi:colanic acid/amylovoran biosynthesis protein
LDRPTVVFGQSIGPVRGRLQRWMVRRALSRLRALYVREPASLACLEELGVRGARLCWDSAFAVPAEPLPEPVAARLPTRFVALTVRQWRFPYAGGSVDEAYQRYLSAVATTIGRLRTELELPVVVVPQAIGPTPVENDLTAARMLEESLGENAGDTVFLDDDFTAGQLTTIYGRAAFVLATRFHSAILAMSAGTPAVAVSYHGPKAPGIMEMMDLKSFVTDIAGTSPEELWSLCRGVLDRREEIEEALGRRRDGIEREVAVSCRAILELA